MNVEIVQQVTARVNKVLSKDLLEKLAIESGFMRRSNGKISAFAFVMALVVQASANGKITLVGMAELMRSFCGASITAQALCSRLGSIYAVRLLRRCYSHILSLKTELSRDKLEEAGLLGKFENILIEDSTYCTLNEHVSESFKGVGGSASKSGYKIHTIWNAITSKFLSLDITPGNVTDQSRCNHILSMLKPVDLVLRDLGYFSISCFKEIANKKAFFLSRFKIGVRVYTLDGKLIEDLPGYLDEKIGDSNMVETDVLIGAKYKFRVRLAAYLVPTSVYEQRRRKQNRCSQKNGRTTSKVSKNFARYTMLITNIPTDFISADKLITLYGFRWQIELIFKTFKSNLNIHMIRGQKKERVECYIISRLIAIVAISNIFSDLMTYVYGEFGRELSFDKFVSWVLRHRYLMVLFCPEQLDSRVMQMKDLNILTLCKQKRSRKTSRELLEAEATFEEIYPSFQSGKKEQLAC
ncbi:MAG: IS4 family transposase [Bacteroidota bacterium]|nr:IS4 family transposase [Bacteroidota bacterium]